ncbi:hypothetical protein B0H17DRAFT_1086889 [Mycena rosella]|uniref:Uncharacterized protein n=1 Tax=Mycena rosella TaxID=1033263 RepID=A0AAD7G986_MYCRO|nr:hypothetical protein B0H17DRAFT_1086889 [Mycena rosella]
MFRDSDRAKLYAARVDFRVIPLEDIDLRKQIRLDDEIGVVNRGGRRACVRRMYTARIEGKKSAMTVAVYQGDDAQEVGSSSCRRRTVTLSSCSKEICPIAAFPSVAPLASSARISPGMGTWTFLIFQKMSYQEKRLITYITVLNGPNLENAVVSSLTLEQYHGICSQHLGQFYTVWQSQSHIPVRTGAIIPWTSNGQLDGSAEIAFMLGPRVDVRDWNPGPLVSGTDVDAIGHWICSSDDDSKDNSAWLSQANHVFSQLQIASNHEEYALVKSIGFSVRIASVPQPPADGYLFVCPEDLETGLNSLQFPDSLAYWSLDPSGAARLSSEEASQLGFPVMTVGMQVTGYFWDSGVYAGLRKFHQAKGFDPDSDNIARYLGQPLFKLSGELHNQQRVHADDIHAPLTEGEEITQESTTINSAAYLTVDEKPEPLSRCWQFLVLAEAILIIFLALCWLHEYACG